MATFIAGLAGSCSAENVTGDFYFIATRSVPALLLIPSLTHCPPLSAHEQEFILLHVLAKN